MNGSTAEKMFKLLFKFAGVLLAVVVIGIFLLIIKIVLLFIPELHIMGITIM